MGKSAAAETEKREPTKSAARPDAVMRPAPEGLFDVQSTAGNRSTLAVFALFQPILRRVRRAVDRRFDRASYDGQRLADAFAGRLRDEVDITTVTADLDATIRAAVRPTTLGLWVRGRER